MGWRAIIKFHLEEEVVEIRPIFDDLNDFSKKMENIRENDVISIELEPFSPSDLVALAQKGAAQRPWRIHCVHCGGTGWREPTGEIYRSSGLIECDQCQPMPVRIVTGGKLDGS